MPGRGFESNRLLTALTWTARLQQQHPVSNRVMRQGAVLCIAIALAMGCGSPSSKSSSNSTKPEELVSPLRCELRAPQLGGWWSLTSRHHLHFLLFWHKSGLKVYQGWNSWGYYARSFVGTDAGGRKHELAARPTEFTKNAPATLALDAGDFLITDVYLCDGSWSVTPKLPTGQPATLSLTGRFRISPDRDAVAHGVWTGEIQSAAPIDVYLGRDCVRALNAEDTQ
jgi:hypothetical protein